ncbi:MAG: hypothetical protein ACI4U3_10500 [Traorella sp.]
MLHISFLNLYEKNYQIIDEIIHRLKSDFNESSIHNFETVLIHLEEILKGDKEND